MKKMKPDCAILTAITASYQINTKLHHPRRAAEQYQKGELLLCSYSFL